MWNAWPTIGGAALTRANRETLGSHSGGTAGLRPKPQETPPRATRETLGKHARDIRETFGRHSETEENQGTEGSEKTTEFEEIEEAEGTEETEETEETEHTGMSSGDTTMPGCREVGDTERAISV